MEKVVSMASGMSACKCSAAENGAGAGGFRCCCIPATCLLEQVQKRCCDDVRCRCK